MSKDSPSQRVNMFIDELLWPLHPLGRDVAGSAESVSSIAREAMVDFLKGHYQPGDMVVAVAGNIEHGEVTAAVEQVLGRWSNRRTALEYQPYIEQAGKKVHVESKPTEQAHLCLALPGLSLFHPQRFVLDLLNIILGEGMSSRLFVEIRDRLGLAYSINSYVDHFLDCGTVTVYAGVQPKNLKVAIGAVLEQLSRLKEPIPEDELLKAKELSKGRLLLRMEDSRSVAGWLGGQELLTGRILTIDQIISIIDKVTAEQLRQLARELLRDDKLRLAVVGSVDSDEPLEQILKL
jgi:predicted Zn-dependent peptidase